MRQVVILGSTGSIGQSTLRVLAQNSEQFGVFALVARSNVTVLLQQCLRFKPKYAVLMDAEAAKQLKQCLLESGLENIEVLSGQPGCSQVVANDTVTDVVAAIVGAAGVPAVYEAVRQGKRILLANKEALVLLGPWMQALAQRHGAVLLPIDSEHNGIFQTLPLDKNGFPILDHRVKTVTLTASGGPFVRSFDLDLSAVTPEQACAHPNWKMGQKVSVDSATMMNKGLELIEAAYLFDAPLDKLRVLLHPQSIVHALVAYQDGSCLAQMGVADMVIPIACALAFPERIDSTAKTLDLAQLGSLEFLEADFKRYPCLKLAYAALSLGGSAPIVLNAANEVAVALFLQRRLPFNAISTVVDAVMAACPAEPLEEDISSALAMDAHSRRLAEEISVRWCV